MIISQNPSNQNPENDAQYHYPGGPNQMVKVGHAGLANSFVIDRVAGTSGGSGFIVCQSKTPSSWDRRRRMWSSITLDCAAVSSTTYRGNGDWDAVEWRAFSMSLRD